MHKKAKLILKSGKDQSLRRLHPWVFSGAIKQIDGNPEDGDIVDIYTNSDDFLACGHYQRGTIAVRVISFAHQEAVDEKIWQSRIHDAYEYRKALGLAGSEASNVFRLIHGEGDLLPGLIVDFYDGTAVMQAHSVGMYQQRPQLLEALKTVLGDTLHTVYDKSEGTLGSKENLETGTFLYGETQGTIVKENHLKFQVNWLEGQKTGFFIDQRENRKLVQHYANGRDVLNMFSYTGGFSIYALAGGASSVHSVDSSKHAISLTNENVMLNFRDTKDHEAFTTDAFSFMNQIDQKYDMIILDPPAFAKHYGALNNALQGYKRLNAKAFQQIRKDGILFTFSCSQVVSKEEFRKSVFAAAANSGRKVRILHQLSQPADHPISIYHPEGEYLKGLVLHVT